MVLGDNGWTVDVVVRWISRSVTIMAYGLRSGVVMVMERALVDGKLLPYACAS